MKSTKCPSIPMLMFMCIFTSCHVMYIHRLPFFRGATTLNAALLLSSSRCTFDDDPFLATSLQPPALLCSASTLATAGSTMPLSAILRRRMKSSAKRRPSRVCELAYTESEMISESAGRSSSCWTKSSTSSVSFDSRVYWRWETYH